MYTLIAIFIYDKNCTDDIYSKRRGEDITNGCKTIISINYCKECIDLGIALSLIILQMIMYRRLIKVMRSRLHFFFQFKKKKIHILYVSNIIYLISRMLLVLLYVVFGGDRLDNYLHKYEYSFDKKIAFKVASNINFVTFFVFNYFSTKYIDFALYVKVWMIGYQVDNRFENMSYFISRSCFFQDEIEDSDSSETNYGDYSEYGSQSIITNIQDASRSTTESSSTLDNEICEKEA